MLLLLTMLACSRPPTWLLQEVYDVPPPPGAVSLDLGPVETSGTYELGAPVVLAHEGHTVHAEILDVQRRSGGVVLTVYADAAGAQRWIESAEPVRVRVRLR